MDIFVSILGVRKLEAYCYHGYDQRRDYREQVTLFYSRGLIHWVLECFECHPDVHTDGRQPEEDRESGELEEKPNEDANFRSEEVTATADDNHQKGDQYGEVQGELQLCDVVVPELLNQEVQQDDH